MFEVVTSASKRIDARNYEHKQTKVGKRAQFDAAHELVLDQVWACKFKGKPGWRYCIQLVDLSRKGPMRGMHRVVTTYNVNKKPARN